MGKASVKNELLRNLSEFKKTESDIAFINLKVEKYQDDYLCYYESCSYNPETQSFYDFLANIDIEYDRGFGRQHVFGHVVFNDGTWLERAEYDGSEWWEYKKLPLITDPVLDSYGDEILNERY